MFTMVVQLVARWPTFGHRTHLPLNTFPPLFPVSFFRLAPPRNPVRAPPFFFPSSCLAFDLPHFLPRSGLPWICAPNLRKRNMRLLSRLLPPLLPYRRGGSRRCAKSRCLPLADVDPRLQHPSWWACSARCGCSPCLWRDPALPRRYSRRRHAGTTSPARLVGTWRRARQPGSCPAASRRTLGRGCPCGSPTCQCPWASGKPLRHDSP